MKVRGTIPSTPFSARLTALCWGALTLLVPVAVSACTSSSSPTTPTVTFSPSVTTGTASGGAPTASDTTPSSGSSTETGTPGVSPTSTPPTAEATVTQTVTVPPSTIPPAAPVTGGGGTAGFQGTLLLALGAAAILAGAAGLIYRRWLGRGR
jgi:hypothetical protein